MPYKRVFKVNKAKSNKFFIDEIEVLGY